MISYTDELYHHGIKGQKWGVRRYRNADGTLTEAGKNRELWRQRDGKTDKNYRNDASTNKVLDRVSGDYQNASQIQSSGSNIAGRGSNISRLLGRNKMNKIREDVGKETKMMSDEELRQKINRMNLERQYTNLKTENIRTGYDSLTDTLSVAGDVLAIGASAAAIAAAIYKIKTG